MQKQENTVRCNELQWLGKFIQEAWQAELDGGEEYTCEPNRLECIKIWMRAAEARAGSGFDRWVERTLSMSAAEARSLIGSNRITKENETA